MPAWPHVETGGLLCLSTTRFSDDSGIRALTVLQDAYDVLNLDEAARAEEFRREFVSYWSQKVKPSSADGFALLDAVPQDREIFYFQARKGQLIFADHADDLAYWLTNNGINHSKAFLKAWLAWPESLSGPDSFPKDGRDVMELVGQQNLEGLFRAGEKLPVLLGLLVSGVPVFVGALLAGASESFAARGFRPSRPRPARLVADLFKVRSIVSMSVERLDPSWVHGRDTNASLDVLQETSVGVIGCGAIGGYLARGITQAGVGMLTLVDHDDLKAANLGRHVLGAEWLGRPKARAMAEQLARDFPHAHRVTSITTRFQDLTPVQLTALATCNVVVLAGVDLPAELAVDRWLASLDHPPAVVWTWTEQFAAAGHALALFERARIGDALDPDGRFRYRSTSNWDPAITTLGEAGCGTSFQPYDAADMMYTVLMAQRLTLDALLGNISNSQHRAWFGNRDLVIAKGATPSEDFSASAFEKIFEWPR